jgi:hypothetical protein
MLLKRCGSLWDDPISDESVLGERLMAAKKAKVGNMAASAGTGPTGAMSGLVGG